MTSVNSINEMKKTTETLSRMRLFRRRNHKRENRKRERVRESVTAATVGRKEKQTIQNALSIIVEREIIDCGRGQRASA